MIKNYVEKERNRYKTKTTGASLLCNIRLNLFNFLFNDTSTLVGQFVFIFYTVFILSVRTDRTEETV